MIQLGKKLSLYLLVGFIVFQATGLAMPILGAMSGVFFAGGRLPQLLILFLAFCLVQIMAFGTGEVIWRSRAYGFMLLGLILCQITPWYWAGRLFDFRFDFMAYCLYGVWACAVIRSGLFLDRGWSILCGLIGAFLVLNRFLTVVYLLGVWAGFAVFCAVLGILRSRDRAMAKRTWQRLCNLVLCIGILMVIATPFLLRSWRDVYQYYGIGHVLGAVKDACANQNGLHGLVDNLLFYPNAVLRDQWGLVFVLGSAIVLIVSGITGLRRLRGEPDARSPRCDEVFLLQVIFLIGAIVGPLLVLTMDTDKSPVVCSIVGIPAALLVVTLSARIAGVRQSEPTSVPKPVLACSLAVFVLGIAVVVDELSRHLPEYSERDDLLRLVELAMK